MKCWPNTTFHPEEDASYGSNALDFGSTTLNWIRVTHAETELSSTHDTTTTRRSAVGNAWAGWGARCDTRIFFPLDVSSPVSHPMCDVPFPPRRRGEYRKGMIPARTLYQGVRGSVWESGSVIGEDRRRSGSSCALPKSVPQEGQKESGGIVLAAICWAPIAQRRCHPEEALYLPTFTH
jgi:hypothetical protein